MKGTENDQPRRIFYTINPDELHEYTTEIQKEWKHIPCGPKGEVERFLERDAGFFPPRLYIPRIILQSDDTHAVRRELLQGIRMKCFMGVRSIADRTLFGGEKLPWEMEITTDDEVDRFLDHTLPVWQQRASWHNFRISQLTLMFNPPEIGTRKALPNQFVARIEKDMFNATGSGSRILVELNTGTNQLRGLDKTYNKSSEGVIRLQYVYTPTGILIKRELQIGYSHPVTSIFYDIMNEPLSHVRLENISPARTDITRKALLRLDEIVKNPDFQKRLEFFADIGLNMIEFQGWSNTITKDMKALIYGLRGPNDETFIAGLRPYNFESRLRSE